MAEKSKHITMPDRTITGQTVGQLRDELHGEVLTPDDDGYDEARQLWNAMIDHKPDVIAQPTGVADVLAAVNIAREYDVELSAKGGGHHVSGAAVPDEGLLLDLGEMNRVDVDPESEIARVGAGATWGDVDHETQAFGLAVPGGQDPNIGVAGLTLGGGVGWLSRQYGLSCDNLRAVELVTADGEFVRASEDEHPDLFWGLRGGGGRFGVVTSFEYELHEVDPEILAGSLAYPLEDASEVARH
jgi:FAD/FMN-containing dehydrogenase